MPVPALEAVVFDMDGTLVDSERLSFAAWAPAARELGIEVPEELIRQFIGRNKHSYMSILADHLNGDLDLAWRLYDLHIEYFNRAAAVELEAKPGALEALEALHAAGVRLAVASSSPIEAIEQRLRDAGMLDKFSVLVSGDEVAKSKPEPDIFVEAARRMGVEPAACAAIEDSFNGVRSGHAAGMRTFMVPDLLEPTPEIAALCERVLASLHELPAALGVASADAPVAGAADGR